MKIHGPLPDDILVRIRTPLRDSGVEVAAAALLQPLELMLELAGEEVRSHLFVVQAEGGPAYCLRPDSTVAIARRHLEGKRSDARYFYEGATFRADAGMPEEFLQLGLEVFSGSGSIPLDDAAIASLAWRSAVAGGRDDLVLRLGDVALFEALIASLDLPAALTARLKRVSGRPRLLMQELSRAKRPTEAGGALAGLLAGLSPERAAMVLEEIWALSGVDHVGGREASAVAARLVRKAEAAGAPALTDAQAGAIQSFMEIDAAPTVAFAQVAELAGRNGSTVPDALRAWETRLEGLTKSVPADRIRFAPALGHAFVYYDGATFEVHSSALGAGRPVAVGGRYDRLLARLSGEPTNLGAVGCMVRPWRAWAGGEV